MNKVGLHDYMLRVTAWQRAPAFCRRMVTTRDETGRPCKELWAYGKCYTRIVDLGHGLRQLYADKGGMRKPEQGKISFSRWDERDEVFGHGQRIVKQMTPRRV